MDKKQDNNEDFEFKVRTKEDRRKGRRVGEKDMLTPRSFMDLTHSERAAALTTRYNELKKESGYRTDLREETASKTCDPLEHSPETAENKTPVPVERRSDTRVIIGAQFGISSSAVQRYLRVDKLIPALKLRLDNGEIALRTAEALSYLKPKEQEIVESLLIAGRKASAEQANVIKKESAKREIDEAFVMGTLNAKFL